MIPAEQWQKEAGTHAIHCQGADEVYPNVGLELIKRIQRDAWEQGIRDYIKAGLEMVVRQGGFTDEPEKDKEGRDYMRGWHYLGE